MNTQKTNTAFSHTHHQIFKASNSNIKNIESKEVYEKYYFDTFIEQEEQPGVMKFSLLIKGRTPLVLSMNLMYVNIYSALSRGSF